MIVATAKVPLIVGIGGTLRKDSASENALNVALSHVRFLGARTAVFANEKLDLPPYNPRSIGNRCERAEELVQSLRSADGLIISSPCYHGSISGLIKNALDYAADLQDDENPLLPGRAVGLIACAFGPQATATTLIAMRSIVHALRAWPTPTAVPINTLKVKVLPDLTVSDTDTEKHLLAMASQVVEFAQRPPAGATG